MRPPIYGTSIFCDDIRNEIDGKISLIGCYSHAIVLKEPPPFIMPKFGIHIMLICEKIVAVESLNLRILAPGPDGDEITIIDVAPEFPPEARSPPKKKQGAFASATKVVQDLIISPFEIFGTGTVRVVVNFNGTDIAAGALRIIGPDDMAPHRIQAKVSTPIMPVATTVPTIDSTR
jgi:hypothetical protein